MSAFIILYIILILILSLVVGFFILVLAGNLMAMKFLAKNGVAVFSSDIEKDSKLLDYINKEGIGWLSISDICYSPVMLNSGGKYLNHNFLSKSNLNGELYLSESKKAQMLSQFALKSDYAIKDLSIIKGSNKGNGAKLRQANFSQLRKIKEKINQKSIVKLCENGVIREFIPICVLDLFLSDKEHVLKYDNRNDFLTSLLEVAKVSTNYDYKNNNVLFLECGSNIDNLMVMLIEVQEV